MNTISAPFLRLVMLMLVATAFVSCSQLDKNASGSPNPVGIYQLIEVDGKKVPASVSHHGNQLEVLSGAITFHQHNTCSSKTVFIAPNGSEISREVDASFSRNGSRLTMKWRRAGTTTGTIQNDIFSMNNEGMIFVYSKSTP